MKFFNKEPKTQSTVVKKKKGAEPTPTMKVRKSHINKKTDIKKSTMELSKAASEMLEKDGGLEPMIFCDFEWLLVPEDLEGEKTGMGFFLDEKQTENRREFVHKLGGAAAILKLLGVIGKPKYIKMASEAWAAFPLKGDYDPSIRPSEHPDRKEVLMVTTMDSKHTTAVTVRDIIRDDTSTKLKDGEHTEIMISEGDKESLLSDFWTAYERGLELVKEEGHYKMFKDIAKNDPVHTYKLVLATMLESLNE